MLFREVDRVKKIAAYLALVSAVLFSVFWMIMAYNIQNRIQHYLSKKEAISFLYDRNKVRTRGFPFSFLLTVNDPKLCLNLLNECIQLSSVQLRTNIFARKIIISALLPAELHSLINDATEITLTADLNQLPIIAMCRSKSSMSLMQAMHALTVDLQYYSSKEPFHIRFASIRATIGTDLQGWRTTIDTNVEGNRVKVLADSVFHSSRNFYIDFKQADVVVPGYYSLSMDGVWAFYNNANHVKITADISNIENFTKIFWRNIKVVLKNKLSEVDDVDDAIVEQYMQEIIAETEPVDDGKRMTIRSEDGMVLIGRKSISKLLHEAIYDYIRAVPQR